MKLSILVPSVYTRRASFLSQSLEMLYSQYEKLSPEQQKEVEILYLIDSKSMMLGEKRNSMVDMCCGEYVCHVDDDDRISEDYISTILDAIENTNADIINFQVSVSLDNEESKICNYSKEYKKDFNTDEGYFRIPNHICCVRRELALQVSFPNKVYGEDSAYSKTLLPLLKTEHNIDKVLYYYDYNSQTTETQQELSRPKKEKRQHKVDVVILSNAKTPELKQMTQNTVNTCKENSGGINVNIVVVEQNPRVFYKNARVIQPEHPEVFNYNQRMNQGIKSGQAEYLLLCNNDLIFTENYLEELLKEDYPVVSPKCPKDSRQKEVKTPEKGYQTGKNFSGFCFMIKRELWEKLPQENLEMFPFWFADNVVVEELRKLNIEPMIVPTSIVQHLGSTTLKQETDQEQIDNMTWKLVELFNNKYNTSHFEDNKYYQEWKRKK